MAREVIDKDPINKTVTFKHGARSFTLYNVDPWPDTDEGLIALSFEYFPAEYTGDDPVLIEAELADPSISSEVL